MDKILIVDTEDREAVETKLKTRGGVNGNGMTVKSEVNFWKAEYFKCLLSLRNAHRGLERLSKTKSKYKDIAKFVNNLSKNTSNQRERKDQKNDRSI